LSLCLAGVWGEGGAGAEVAAAAQATATALASIVGSLQQSITSCVTHPTVGSCLEAAGAAVLLLGTSFADAGGDAAEEGAAGASIPDSTIIARGGQSSLPPPGEVFFGRAGADVEEAGQGVVHGSFRWTTAGDIRAEGGTVEPAPEFNKGVGQTNYQHVDVCLGEGPVNGAT
jgi:hypothetical protein